MQLKCKFQGRIGGISRQSHQAPGTKAPPQAPSEAPPKPLSDTKAPPQETEAHLGQVAVLLPVGIRGAKQARHPRAATAAAATSPAANGAEQGRDRGEQAAGLPARVGRCVEGGR